MVMAITILMIIAILIPKPVPIPISVMRQRLADASCHESGEENGHYQQHSAVMPQHFIFHIRKVTNFSIHVMGPSPHKFQTTLHDPLHS
jgi:hypothetical protein